MKQPKAVLQLFHNLVVLGAEHRDAERRRALTAWYETVLSTSGFLEDDLLVLGDEARERQGALEAADVVVLNDSNGGDSRRLRRTLSTYQGDDLTLLQLPGPGKFRGLELFRIARAGDGLELHLDGTTHAGWIGRPGRGDFKLAELRPGRPVRITLNGKADFTMTGRRARQYKIIDYIAVHLGTASRFETRAGLEQAKPVPREAARHVDLRKVLY